MRTLPLLLLLAGACRTHTQGSCPSGLRVSGGEELDYRTLFETDGLHYGIDGWDTGSPWVEGVHVITTVEEGADFKAATGVSLADVDLDTHQVAVLTTEVSSTCGMYLDELRVRSLRGRDAPHVDATIVDTSGFCPGACDMEENMAVVVAVEHAGPDPITACVRLKDRCE